MYLEKSFITVAKYLEPPTEGTSTDPQTSRWISSSNSVVILFAFSGKGWPCCFPIVHPSQVWSAAALESKFSQFTISALFKSFRLCVPDDESCLIGDVIQVGPDCLLFPYSKSRQEWLSSFCKACRAYDWWCTVFHQRWFHMHCLEDSWFNFIGRDLVLAIFRIQFSLFKSLIN